MAANAAEYNTPLDDETAASWRTTWPLLHFAHHVQLHRAITRVTSWCRTLIRAVLVVVRFHAIFAAENRRICLRYSEDNNYANLASNSRQHRSRDGRTWLLQQFFCWTLSEGSLRMLSSIKAEISNFCILLPKLDHFGTPDREQIHVQYTVIDSEWNVLHHKNSRWIMCAPRFPGARYEESGN